MSNEELVAAIQSGAPGRMGELWEQVRRFVIHQLRQAVSDALMDLGANQWELLRLRYWEGLPLDEIGHRHNMSVEAARQIEAKAIRQLRRPATAVKLRQFCDFDFYGGTGLGSFMASGASIQERYLMKQERLCSEKAKS